jgi:hypothetical protein
MNLTLSSSELNAKSATLVVNLFQLVKKTQQLQEYQAYIKNTLNYVKSKEGALASELYKKLVALQ